VPERRGKWLVVRTDNETAVLLHFGMTGQLVACPTDEPAHRHDRVRLDLSGGRGLRYRDQHKLQGLRFAGSDADIEHVLDGQGPDAASVSQAALQHVHSFLEVLPLTAAAFTACLHWDMVRAAVRGDGGADRWKLLPKDRPLPAPYLAGIAGAIGVFVVLPYAEEMVRCVRRRPRTAVGPGGEGGEGGEGGILAAT
jgi:hypothetical protein